AFVLFDTAPAFFTDHYPFTKDRISPEVYFWLLAHRVVPAMEACPWLNSEGIPIRGFPALPGGKLAEDYASVNHLYHNALPGMKRLRLTKGGTYTLWLN